MKKKTQKMTVIAMLCSLSYVIMVVGRIPVVLFLKYDPKDVVIAIGGFLYGPLSSFIVSVIVSLLEMFTVSETGIIGCIMNIISSCSFACTAAVIYKKRHTLAGAAIGLATGWIVMTTVMLLWNFLITPLYLGYPRQAVADLLLPAFLPFNLLKGGMNFVLTLLLYRPIAAALQKTRFMPVVNAEEKPGRLSLGMAVLLLFLLATGVMLTMAMQGLL